MAKKRKNNNIIIKDWTGRILYQGDKDSERVLQIMEENEAPNDDIFVCWEDIKRTDNVYELIDF